MRTHKSLIRAALALVASGIIAGCGVAQANVTHLDGISKPLHHPKRAALRCRASVSNRYPIASTNVGVRVRAAKCARIRVTLWYSRTVNSEKSGHAGIHGRHTFWYHVEGRVGHRVNVIVHDSRHGRRGYCRTWFEPQNGMPPPSPSPTPTSRPTAKPTPTPTVKPTPTSVPTPTATSSPPVSAWCTITSIWTRLDSDQDEWLNDVYIQSNQSDKWATVSGGGKSGGWWTNESGSDDLYLDGPGPGTYMTVTVGGAECSATSS